MSQPLHVPIMVHEVVDFFKPQPGQKLADCTFGVGGHTRALLEKCPSLRVFAIDRDPESQQFAIQLQKDFPQASIDFFNVPFDEALEDLKANGEKVDMLLADLGFSSYQLNNHNRGMSYHSDAPLDLRLNQSEGVPASQWLSEQSEDGLRDVFKKYGEEPLASQIARKIVTHLKEGHPLETTKQLATLIEEAYKKKYSRPSTTPPAAKVFQAIRITLNDEFFHLENLLNLLTDTLATKARAAFITFHSLEDRLVKHFLQDGANPCTCPPDLPRCVCGKEPLWELAKPFPTKPTDKEVQSNPRAHSALLRKFTL